MSSRIFTHSPFNPEEFGNGGCKRTAQIRELLNNNGIGYSVADFGPHNPDSKSLGLYLKGVAYKKKLGLKPNEDHHLGRYLKTFENFISEQHPELYIAESTFGHQALLLKTLRVNQIPSIALPHNIESLVKGNRSFISGKQSPNWFNEEIEYLAFSNKVFTISREEQWLLSLYGIDADCLPYYPTEKVKAYLLNIRAERDQRSRRGKPGNILLLGTFFNGPTMQGYIDLLKHISKIDNLTINIVGFGSEALKEYGSAKVRIWGSVDNETLRTIIIENDIAVIHQPPTTGALTRIPELLITGIPIFANQVASRSYTQEAGVSVYYNYKELYELINTPSLDIPPIPAKPLHAEKRFIETIRSFA